MQKDFINQGRSQQLQLSHKQQIILVDNPRAAFIKIVNKIYPRRVETRTSSTAIISESATIGFNCYIGNYTVVGKDCEIGNNTVIYESCYSTEMQDRQ
jgi:UDP-3-O-[3-hydroxymyristoyl] glucosamine N-acyltransferase